MVDATLSYQLNTVEGELQNLGYHGQNGKIIRGYEFAIGDGQKDRADLLAFASPHRWDISTACIAVQQWPNGGSKQAALRRLSYIGAPLALFALPDKVEWWSVVSAGSTMPQRPQAACTYDRLSEHFGRYRIELLPESLLRAKRKAQQLSFFHIDPTLEPFARKATQSALVEQFQQAISLAPPGVFEDHPAALSRMAIWILAARILQDKLVDYSDLQTRDVQVLLKAAQQYFPNYFGSLERDLAAIGLPTVEILYEGLVGDFTFRSLTNDMLAYFYENTLVNDEIRQELGIYYTPRYITESILRRLPLEDLRPEERTVLDGTCGSGNMLLAAYDRLSSLLPSQWALKDSHNYLLEHIWGVDKDPFACAIARLSLLLYALPAGDSWKVIPGDVFQANPERLFGQKPHIIVGNPPFKQALSPAGKRVQRAAQVFDIYLDWLEPGGLLGVVVPLTFLHSATVARERERLLRTCDILEIWHLPEGAIPGSSIGTAVILARKLPSFHPNMGRFFTRVRKATRLAQQELEDSWPRSVNYVVTQEQWLSNAGYEMVSSPFNRIWQRIERIFPAAQPGYCEIHRGIQPGREARQTHFSDLDRGPGWRRVLDRNTKGRVLEPYLIDWAIQRNKYFKYPSDEIERPRDAEHFEKPNKLIVNAKRNARSPWRFYAAIDQDKLLLIENFYCALPSGTTTVEELAAVLNSTVANAWFAGKSYNRNIPLNILRGLPFPTFDEHQKQALCSLVWKITELKKSLSGKRSEHIRQWVCQLDEIVFDAYGISSEERVQMRRWMSRFPRPGQKWERLEQPSVDHPIYEGRQWILTGQVVDIDADHEMVTLWISGRSAEVPIPPNMPGWTLRPGAAFEAAIPWEQRYLTDLASVRWLSFEPLGYGYLSDEELFSLLAEHVDPE